MIDLHVHSTFSDGSYTPTKVAAMAIEAGLTAMALTDHDSTSGITEFMKACEGTSLIGIPGVEISADVPKGTFHMLGYYLDIDNKPLQDALLKIRDGREIRNAEILEKVNKLGIPLTWDEVRAYAGEDVVGRPHFAMAMMAKGYVSSKEEAFDKYLKKGKSAYADRFRLTPEDSVAMIKGAGGIAVLAHPFTLEMSNKNLSVYLNKLKEIGLSGVEVYYSEHNAQQVKDYERLCKESGLIATGGSDFHGEINPKVRIGTGFGNLNVPDSIIDELAALRKARI